ncbi:hypothetical protein DXG01_009514 [Tephrocybe rancida]|nr:hypothetical protein DXG01_009514 [Tephrocybe rancida]
MSFRKAGYQAIDRICDYYYNLEKLPVLSKVEPGYLKNHIPLTAPEQGEDFQVIADDYQKLIVPGCTFEGILADLYSTSAVNPGFNWIASPACTELEALVMDWACRLLGLSPEFLNSSEVGGGAIQSTASDSALIAAVAARSLFQRDDPEILSTQLVIYTTSQTHSLGVKAGLVLGLSVRVLEVKAEDNFSLRGETLRIALEEDEKLGIKPFILFATVGTTSSGAIDNLPEIQQIGTCYFEWGLVNFDASAMWVRDRKHLTDALDVTPPFLRTKQGDAGTVIDYRNWHLALGRRFRSLKLWFVLRSFGAEGFRSYIRKSISLNQVFADFVRRSDKLTLVTPPSFALSVFRLDPKRKPDQAILSLETLNKLNKLFHTRISARHDILLTPTVLNGVSCIRLAVGAARTEIVHIQHACDLLHKEAELTLEEWERVNTKEDN